MIFEIENNQFKFSYKISFEMLEFFTFFALFILKKMRFMISYLLNSLD